MRKENTPYIPKPFEIAGFELFGKRLPNGKVEIGTGSVGNTVMDDFPEKVEVCGAVYTLEEVKKNTDENGNIRDNIEWGIYV